MLNYKVNGDGQVPKDIISHVLKLRGIDNPLQYLNLDDSVVYNYALLENIDDAAACIQKHMERKSKIAILVDCDCDGYTSAAALFNYMKKCDTALDIHYLLHAGKEHGLSEDIVIPDDIDLVLIPDAGSNDVERCKDLKEQGKDIVIIDHHICDVENPYATVVNSQNNYPNKELSGVGVVYKVLQKLDDDLWQTYADRYLDLVAVGMIGDMMDERSLETRYLSDCGRVSIRNKLLQSLVNVQSFSISQPPTINDIAFYICPLINAAIRVGDEELKDLMFRAFIETDEIFLYKKRREKEEVPEDIYERVARLLKNNKEKQDKVVEGTLDVCVSSIEHNGSNNNKMLFVDVTNLDVRKELGGLVATKIAESYGKPCLMLRQIEDTEMYGGSVRNIRNSPIDSLKSLLDSTGLFEEVAGHDNAFGVKIKDANVIKAIKRLNRILMDETFDRAYCVDFIIGYEDVAIDIIKAIDDAKWVFCKGVDEPLLLVTGIMIDPSDVSVIGKNRNTWKVKNDVGGFELVKFRCDSNDEILHMSTPNSITINAICKASINSYKGKLTPQLIVKDYEICS